MHALVHQRGSEGWKELRVRMRIRLKRQGWYNCLQPDTWKVDGAGPRQE